MFMVKDAAADNVCATRGAMTLVRGTRGSLTAFLGGMTENVRLAGSSHGAADEARRQKGALAGPPGGMKSAIDVLFTSRNVVRAKTQICVKDAELRNVHYLHSGICVGYDLLADGRRQIISLYLPGDLVDAGAVNRRYGGQNVVAMTESVIGTAGLSEIRTALAEDAGAYEIFVKEIVKRHAMLEVWICTLGRKSAIERMAMFFCEILTRMRIAGAGKNDTCTLPLNQIDLSDVLGISVVHVNRVLKTLRETNLASFDGGRLEIHDFDRLASIAEFDPAYLM